MCQDCIRLHDELQKQAYIMYGLRKRIRNLNGELKHERQERVKLLKEKKEQQHYRNSRKKGMRGRNG